LKASGKLNHPTLALDFEVRVMNERDLLMIPGPTNVDPMILRAMARPTISHTSSSFASIAKETMEDLGRIFKTKNLILPLAGSGTLGAEVALANIIESGDRVLAISGGYFGDRLAEVAATLGARVDKLELEWGSAAKMADVERKLSDTSYKALLAVHVDTSTGVANPAKELAGLAKRKGALFVLDTVCSMGGMDVQVDNWGIDVCFTGSQKALAIPPGMTVISFSPKAMEAREKRKASPTFYYGDVKRWLPVLQDPTKYFATPAVNMVYALHESCKLILAEQLEERFRRHAKLATAFRAGLRAVGLRMLCEDAVASNTLTVAYYPEGVRDGEFRKVMAEEYGVVVAGGLGPLKERAFRVGHMGNVNRNDILATLSAIEGSFAKQGHAFRTGSGVSAANQVLAKA
jgi:alanine-glyoxylate transaminase/serine-glyoxylate transaminase/serine-pyruvate transaminase